MDKKTRIRSNRDFRVVYDKGKSKANKYLVIFFKKNGYDYNRIGFSTTKKLGNSVIRNKVKRLMRESYRINSFKIKEGYDIIFLSRVRAKDASYKQIESAIMHLVKKAGLKN